jgi:hypothetical protein
MAALGRTASIAQEPLVPRLIEELEKHTTFNPHTGGPDSELAVKALISAARELKSSGIPLSASGKDLVDGVVIRGDPRNAKTIRLDAIKQNIIDLIKELKRLSGGRRGKKTGKKSKVSKKSRRYTRRR